MKNLIHTHTKQTGSALIFSLMIMLVMTIIGVSAISTTNLEERISQNFQHDTLAFQAAESSINKIIDTGDPGGTGAAANPFYDVASDNLLIAINSGVGDTSTTVSYDMDPDGTLANTTLTTNSTISYTGGGLCKGMSLTVTCHNFRITTQANLAATSTSATHVQGLYRPAPAPGV